LENKGLVSVSSQQPIGEPRAAMESGEIQLAEFAIYDGKNQEEQQEVVVQSLKQKPESNLELENVIQESNDEIIVQQEREEQQEGYERSNVMAKSSSEQKEATEVPTGSVESKKKEKNNQGFKCDFEDCDYVGKTKDLLKCHQGIHRKPFKCSSCDKRFAIKNRLKKHRLIKHENPDAFQCHICKKNMASKQSLLNHIQTHEDNPAMLFECLQCPKKFRIKKFLKLHHQNIHSGNKFCWFILWKRSQISIYFRS